MLLIGMCRYGFFLPVPVPVFPGEIPVIPVPVPVFVYIYIMSQDKPMLKEGLKKSCNVSKVTCVAVGMYRVYGSAVPAHFKHESQLTKQEILSLIMVKAFIVRG